MYKNRKLIIRIIAWFLVIGMIAAYFISIALSAEQLYLPHRRKTLLSQILPMPIQTGRTGMRNLAGVRQPFLT